MVLLTSVKLGSMRTFGLKMRGKVYNHRKPLRYQRFMDHVDTEEIVSHYSRDDIDSINPRQGQRTFRDAQQTMGRKNYLLPNLSDQDLEINQMFQKELDRQRAIVARVNKISVIIDSNPGKETELLMNKDLSTPYDCARHIHDSLTTRSVVAQVFPQANSSSLVQSSTSNNENESNSIGRSEREPNSIYWDMHRPLEESCKLRFKHFTDRNIGEVNKIYWRSCSFVLGMALRLAFKDEIKMLLHSWPKPDIKSGSFVYDVALNLDQKWKPAEQELRAFTKVMWEIKTAALPFERLRVKRDVATQFFAYNPFKLAQIDSILENESSQGKVTVYRCGGLLDISIGPMISDTSQIGRISLAAVHPFESMSQNYQGVFYRFQGVSLPQQLPVSSYLYQNVLLNEGKKLNKASL